MKNKNDKTVRSIVGVDSVFEGTLTTKETTRIDGVVKGNIRSESTLIIGKSAKIEGNIYAANIYIAGEIHGDLVANGKIETCSSGKIYGNIKTKSLIIDEHAVFQGKCEMNMKEEELQKESVAAEQK